MVDQGDEAPDFTAPIARDGIEPFTLSESLGEGPVVLAFFPGAFTSVCSSEMSTFQEELDDFEEAGATVYGVSVDSPFSLEEFREQEGIEYGMISDTNKEAIDAYDVRMDFADMGYEGVAKRATFVIDEGGEIVYKWVSDDPGVEPDYAEVAEAARAAA
jgi:glutaredoxin-dependent peroxiredoxin